MPLNGVSLARSQAAVSGAGVGARLLVLLMTKIRG